MHSARVANGETGSATGGDMRRLRRRGRLATGIGSAGYIATFITSIIRSTPSDDQIVRGVEIASGIVTLAGFLVAFTVWVLTECTAYVRLVCGVEDKAASSIDYPTLALDTTPAANAVPITSARSHRQRGVAS